MLNSKGHGYPLWVPEPSDEMLENCKDGIKVGDVGFITQDGSFEFLFNVTLPENHEINKRRGVPRNFEPLELDRAGFSNRKNHDYDIQPGDTFRDDEGTEVRDIGYFNARAHNLPIGANIGFQLHSRHSEGAALLLPQGASKTDYIMANQLRDYAAAHAESWYRYLHERGYSDIQNGSLCIISGFRKTACYHNAVFHGGSPSDSSRLRLGITSIPGKGFRADFTSGDQRYSKPGHSSQNLTVFIQGWKIMLRPKSWWARMAELLRRHRDDNCHRTTVPDLLRISGDVSLERVMSRPAMPHLPLNSKF
ncbi:hypothetical protein K435DRAFT_665746 [Dendrothele bispora CBS 962.96]|uniref:Uncharacterized protein n=1 Tax=Dendrothele bispora (strain CBS 962.96) TaxID=1314807 RepID=A0A4S8M1I6_DENBC|nr:hypothetical protein K435DRAFT_665746 [Dendrothele bispora CBS 962.96]